MKATHFRNTETGRIFKWTEILERNAKTAKLEPIFEEPEVRIVPKPKRKPKKVQD